MTMLVVFESMFGNTEAIARAIGEGLGEEAVVVATDDATPQLAAAASLIVAGCPVHNWGLPSQKSHATAERFGDTDTIPAATADTMPMREWLARVPAGSGLVAAFDTRYDSRFAGSASKEILKELVGTGRTPVDEPQGFHVHQSPQGAERGAMLKDGELERAREWGKALAATQAPK